MLRTLCLLVLCTALACTSTDQPGHIAGTATWQGRPIAMALVEAYPKAERHPPTPPVAAVPSAEDGGFLLELPPGRYWVWARVTVSGEAREQRLVGQAPDNPIVVAAGETASAAIALEDATGFAHAAGPAGTGARGSVAGAPPTQTTVYAYPGHSVRPLGPGFRAAIVPQADSGFQVDLAPGAYTLAARWRSSGADHGNLQPGDRVAVTPVTVTPGHYADAGQLTLQPVDPAVWQTVAHEGATTGTWIEGHIRAAEGTSQAGIRVLAFDDPRMAGKPLALSPPTGPDGRFRVYVPDAGRYFLGARSRIGGPAEPGERSGAFRGEDGDGIHLDTGDRQEQVEIRVEEVW